MNDLNIETLRSGFDGNVILPDTQGYDEARTIWNAMFDKKPAVIAQCSSTADVVKAVNFGRTNDLLISIKCGGHNSAGTAVCDDGLVIDLSMMRNVEVDPTNNTVNVQGGCLIGDVDAETQKYGLAVSSGIISHTGVGGVSLGGGFGWISRKFGFSIDNLLSAEIVTAGGEIVAASEVDNPDLFWAIRGGGGNFGVITNFEFKAAKIGTTILSGPIIKRFEDIKEYFQFHREHVRMLPDEMTVWMVVRHAPPLPFLPEKYHGKLVIIVVFAWLGDPEEGQKLIQTFRDQGETLGDGVGENSWKDWQSAFDALNDHGARNYWKSHHLREMSDSFIEQIRKYAQIFPTEECDTTIMHMEGYPSRIDAEATAFPHRHTPFVINIHTRWRDEADDEKALKWVNGIHKATEDVSQGVYVNFMSAEGQNRVKQAYTENVWNRLVECKRKWDPNNLFKMNQNIDPN